MRAQNFKARYLEFASFDFARIQNLSQWRVPYAYTPRPVSNHLTNPIRAGKHQDESETVFRLPALRAVSTP